MRDEYARPRTNGGSCLPPWLQTRGWGGALQTVSSTESSGILERKVAQPVSRTSAEAPPRPPLCRRCVRETRRGAADASLLHNDTEGRHFVQPPRLPRIRGHSPERALEHDWRVPYRFLSPAGGCLGSPRGRGIYVRDGLKTMILDSLRRIADASSSRVCIWYAATNGTRFALRFGITQETAGSVAIGT